MCLCFVAKCFVFFSENGGRQRRTAAADVAGGGHLRGRPAGPRVPEQVPPPRGPAEQAAGGEAKVKEAKSEQGAWTFVFSLLNVK